MRVRGNTLIPAHILGRFAILCAILRQLHLILQIGVFSNELDRTNATTFFVDQLSAGIPLLRLVRPTAHVLFYCHFPDKLLAHRGSWVRTQYRWPFDAWESWSTGCSDGIVVNSRFTQGVFGRAFPQLRERRPRVVYPCVDTQNALSATAETPLWKGEKVLLSINRFERKKDVGLAIRAFAELAPEVRKGCRLVLAGMIWVLWFSVLYLTMMSRWLRSSRCGECAVSSGSYVHWLPGST